MDLDQGQGPRTSSAAFSAPRTLLSRGLTTVLVACVALFSVSAIFAPTSVTRGPLLGMLPFAAVLAIVALGQTLVIQQGGIDLSVPGSISLVVVICTHQAAGDDGKLLQAVVMALVAVVLAGLLNGLLIGRLALNPIIATLGTNALLYSAVFGVSGGIPRTTTSLLAETAGGLTLGIPNSVYFAVGATIVTTVLVKSSVAGRRFEAIGANPIAAATAGLHTHRHRVGAYVWAQIHYWLGGVLLAGIVTQPTAFQGNSYLLPSVAAVVLGGTSLLGGRGNLTATVVAALFLSQLEQFVLALGVTFAVRTLVEAAALVVGVGLYTVDWRAIRRRFVKATGPPAPAMS
jgi:ribose transport system permease protein